jgi:tetratricopeptide (TPR) repeat protein
LYKRLVQYKDTTEITTDNIIQFSAAIMSVHEELLIVLFDYYNSIHVGDHRYRPTLFSLANKEYRYTRDDVKSKTLEKLKKFMDDYPPFVSLELFDCLYNYLKELLYDNPFFPLSDELILEQRIILGNTLQMAYLNFIAHSYSKRNSRGEYKYNYFDDSSDLLEIRETDMMMKHIRKYQYNAVINDFKHVKSHRKHYLIGRAHYHKSEWDKSKEAFSLFLNIVENPKCIADIVTGAYSVQSAYYYMGNIYQKLDKHCTALDYYSKCKNITDKLMLGWNLYDKRLGFCK